MREGGDGTADDGHQSGDDVDREEGQEHRGGGAHLVTQDASGSRHVGLLHPAQRWGKSICSVATYKMDARSRIA